MSIPTTGGGLGAPGAAGPPPEPWREILFEDLFDDGLGNWANITALAIDGNEQIYNTTNTDAPTSAERGRFTPSTYTAGSDTTVVAKCLAASNGLANDFWVVQAQSGGQNRFIGAKWGSNGFQIVSQYDGLIDGTQRAIGEHSPPSLGQTRWLGLRRYGGNGRSYEAYIWDEDPALGGQPLETISTSLGADPSWDAFTGRGILIGPRTNANDAARPRMDDFRVYGAAT